MVLALFPVLPLFNTRCVNSGTLPGAGHFGWFMEVSMWLAMECFDSLSSVVRWMSGCHLWKACINRNCLFYRPSFWSSAYHSSPLSYSIFMFSGFSVGLSLTMVGLLYSPLSNWLYFKMNNILWITFLIFGSYFSQGFFLDIFSSGCYFILLDSFFHCKCSDRCVRKLTHLPASCEPYFCEPDVMSGYVLVSNCVLSH